MLGQFILFIHEHSNQKLPFSYTGSYSVNRDTNGVYETRQCDMFHVHRSKSFIDEIVSAQCFRMESLVFFIMAIDHTLVQCTM